jgi:subtilisin family serine protease
MKKSLVAMLVLSFAALIIPTITARPNAARRPDRRYAQDQILVKLKENIEPREALGSEFVTRAGAIRLERLGRAIAGGEFLVQLDGNIPVEEAVRQAQSSPLVEYAEPNYILRAAATPNDSMFDEQWGLLNSGINGKAGADIGATRAWDITTGSASVVVAVIDTGAAVGHPDLAANAWVNPGEIPGNGIDDDNNNFIDDVNGWNFYANNNRPAEAAFENSHGTHVAGIIGAAGNNGLGVAGVAWHVKIMTVKFLGGADLEGTTADAIRSIEYVIDQRKAGVNVRAINASWAGPDGAQSLRRAIKKAGDQGILFVCAAGNEANDLDSTDDDFEGLAEYPAAWSVELNSIISVASLDRSDNRSSFSSYGHTKVQVGAPGSSIWSTAPGGGYDLSGGTSQAAPHVTGIAALLWSAEPGLAPSEVRDRIIRTAEPIASLASRTVSSGRASAFNALMNSVPGRPQTPAIGTVSTNKKFLTVDGIGFAPGRSVIEVNGVAITKSHKFDSDYRLADGSNTRIKVKLKKSGIAQFFPLFTAVSVTVFDPVALERSAVLRYTRRQ